MRRKIASLHILNDISVAPKNPKRLYTCIKEAALEIKSKARYANVAHRGQLSGPLHDADDDDDDGDPRSRLSAPFLGSLLAMAQVQIANIRWNIYIVYMNWAYVAGWPGSQAKGYFSQQDANVFGWSKGMQANVLAIRECSLKYFGIVLVHQI